MSLEKNHEIKWIDINKLIPNKQNSNKHPRKQIEQLAKIINYQGFRNPIIVSNLSGFIVAGHGRLEAAKHLGLTKVPVSYQDFSDNTQEMLFMTSDNSIALQAEIDMSLVRSTLKDLDFNLDIDFLGFDKFDLEQKDLDLSQLDEKEDKEKKQSYKLEIEFPNEKEMIKKYNELMSDGFLVKALF